MEGLIEKLDARAIKIVLWPTKVAAERCDSFVHLRCRSFSLGTDVSWQLLGKSPFLATLFAKCSVDECSEVISNPISAK
jgi:hypothetical protein